MRTTTEQMPGEADYVAVLHGSHCAGSQNRSTADLTGLYADASRGGHVANGKKYPVQKDAIICSSNTNIAQQIKSSAWQELNLYSNPDLSILQMTGH